MDKWLLIHSDGEFVDVEDDISSISSDWSVMNFQDVEGPECSLTVESPQPSSSSAATTPTNANLLPPPPPPPPSPPPFAIIPQVLPNRRRQNRQGRRRGRAATARHSETMPVANRAVSVAVRQALAPAIIEPTPIALVNAKMSNQAALFAHMHLERRFLRRGGDYTPRAQQDRKHTKWLNGQARIGSGDQRTRARKT
ncbi:hypothetical protein Aperf_G00000018770 [Anoplocephala perfoliata]